MAETRKAYGGEGELSPTDKLHVGVRYQVSCSLLGGVKTPWVLDSLMMMMV